MKENNIKKWFSLHGADVLSYGGLILCIVVFTILSGGSLWTVFSLKVLVQMVCIYAILCLGAIFIYSMGYMDISVGAQVGVYCILCIMIINKTGSIIAGFLVILALALVCGIINGYVAVMLGLPSIVTSIFLMSIFGGIQFLLMENQGINIINLDSEYKTALAPFKSVTAMLIFIIVIALISIYLFNYTRLGEIVKSIGANEKATEFSGIATTKWKVIAYIFFGICIAVASLVLTAKTGSAGKGTGTGYAMDIMVALLLGGMPLSGGMKSKISSALIGSFTYAILSHGLNIIGVAAEYTYVIKAIVFLAVILVTCRKKDGVLPR